MPPSSSSLRRRFLLAMGPAAVPPLLVACGAATRERPPDPGGTDRPPDPVLIVAASATPSDGGPPPTDPVRCTSWVCGSVASPSEHGECGATGDRLVAYGPNALTGPFTGAAHDPSLRGLTFDAERTAQYRTTIGTLPPENYCCYAGCQTYAQAAQGDATVPSGMVLGSTCIPRPQHVAYPSRDPACAAAVQLQGVFRVFSARQGDACCYLTPAPPPRPIDWEEPHHHRGRPVRGEGGPLAAPAPKPATRTSAERRARAEEWLRAARLEHSSVAAFAKLSLDLLRFAAPADLVRRAHQAALDEIRHAQVSFTLASRYAGERLEPGAFDDLARVRLDDAWLDVVRATFVDGCIGETAGALEMFDAAGAAGDAELAAALTAIAEDELRHAELAWAVVAWAAGRDPQGVRRVVAEALATAVADSLRERCESATCAGDAAQRALRDIVVPCGEALCHGARRAVALS